VFTVSRLLLNCDIGESFGNWTMGLDAEVMPFIDCANIACGFHAGDPSIMRKTVSLALSNGVQIGAHPAYQDLVGFGRRSMAYTAQELQDIVHYQIGALDGICRAQGGRGVLRQAARRDVQRHDGQPGAIARGASGRGVL
jgi:UPF0271 protein